MKKASDKSTLEQCTQVNHLPLLKQKFYTYTGQGEN